MLVLFLPCLSSILIVFISTTNNRKIDTPRVVLFMVTVSILTSIAGAESCRCPFPDFSLPLVVVFQTDGVANRPPSAPTFFRVTIGSSQTTFLTQSRMVGGVGDFDSDQCAAKVVCFQRRFWERGWNRFGLVPLVLLQESPNGGKLYSYWSVGTEPRIVVQRDGMDGNPGEAKRLSRQSTIFHACLMREQEFFSNRLPASLDVS